MKQKVKVVFLMNILFYIFIVIHKYFIEDSVPQVLFYMALCFSTAMIDIERKYEKDVMLLSLIDFFIRIIALIIHFSLIFYNDTKYITVALFFINIIIEIILYKKVKEGKDGEQRVKQEDLNKFIKQYRENELAYNNYDDNLVRIMSDLEICGKSNILLILLLVILIISKFIFDNFKPFIFFIIVLATVLIYYHFILFNKISSSTIRRKRNNILMFIIGYIIIFCSEVFFVNYIGIMIVTIRFIGILFFVPIFNERYLIRKKLEKVYINLNQ